LLRRTTARAAAKAYETILASYPDIFVLSRARLSELEKCFATVGLQRQRAAGLREAAKHIVSRFGGDIPAALTLLLKVPNVGAYTARAILSFAHGKPAAVVDSNVVRVLGRIVFGQRQVGHRLEFQQAADVLLPRGAHREFNWAMLDLGALVCRYDVPRCGECPLRRLCSYIPKISL